MRAFFFVNQKVIFERALFNAGIVILFPEINLHMKGIITTLLLSTFFFTAQAQVVGVDVFINEIHYDNVSGDVGEGVEIAGPAGTDLTGYTITPYNGNGGTSYNPLALTGIIPDEGDGFGTLCFAITGLQNGSPDGVALDDGVGTVQFLSYEGSFTATDGPAIGITSTDIGVAESGTTPVGESLQLVGVGSVYSDFTWNNPTTATPCAINTNQYFVGGCNTSNAIEETACATYTSPSGNYTWTTSGLYVDTIPNAAMCDSVIAIDLTILPTYNETDAATICTGTTYIFGTQTLTTGGTYTEVFTSVDGCDSTVVLTLTEVSSYTTNITETICDNETYTLGTQTLNTTGNYSELFTSVAGCDSTVNLDLTVLPTATNTISVTACDSYTGPSGNNTWNTSGTYTDVIPSVNGCDSIITINLTINSSDLITQTASACDSYDFEGNTYTSSGVYQVVYTNQDGCDSIRELNLVITNTPAAPATSGDQLLCDGDTPTDVTVATATSAPLIISGVMDGPLPGGFPKCVEFYALEDIADLSIFGFGSANNGGGTDGEEFTFPNVALTAGDFYRVGTDSTEFFNFFGYYPEEADAWAGNVNGDDAIELFMNAAVIDVFGDINVDGTGTAWDYLDGWAYRINGSQPNDGVFDISEWTFSGINALDNETTNATAATPFPDATFSSSPLVVNITWYDDVALTNQIATGDTYTPTLTAVGSEFYYITAEVNGCTSTASLVEVTINALPTITANSTATTVCDGDAVTLSGAGGVTYAWDNGVTDGTAFNPSATATYTVTGTDANGCTNTDNITVTVNPLPTVTMTTVTPVCVYNDPFDLQVGSPTGGTYSGTGVSGGQFDPSAAGVGTHTITYSYTDGNSCTNTATADFVVDACSSLDELDELFVNVYPNPTNGTVQILTNLSGDINIQVVDLTGKVLINTTDKTMNLSGLATGKYIVQISNATSVIRTSVVKK